MHDGLSQGTVAGPHLNHMENGRVSEEVPHLFQLACDQGTENRVTRGRGPEVSADPVAPGRVKASPGRVQAGLHELGEGNAPMLVNERSDLLLNCCAQPHPQNGHYAIVSSASLSMMVCGRFYSLCVESPSSYDILSTSLHCKGTEKLAMWLLIGSHTCTTHLGRAPCRDV